MTTLKAKKKWKFPLAITIGLFLFTYLVVLPPEDMGPVTYLIILALDLLTFLGAYHFVCVSHTLSPEGLLVGKLLKKKQYTWDQFTGYSVAYGTYEDHYVIETTADIVFHPKEGRVIKISSQIFGNLPEIVQYLDEVVQLHYIPPEEPKKPAKRPPPRENAKARERQKARRERHTRKPRNPQQ